MNPFSEKTLPASLASQLPAEQEVSALPRKDLSAGREEGIPWIWVTGGALTALILLLTLFGAVILFNGLSAFWPADLVKVSDGWGSVVRVERGDDGQKRALVFMGNQDVSGTDFRYYPAASLAAPKDTDVWFIERLEWGPFIGRVVSFSSAAGKPLALTHRTLDEFQAGLDAATARRKRIHSIERAMGENPARAQELTPELQNLRTADEAFTITLATQGTPEKTMRMSQMVRALQPNQMNAFAKLRVYADRVWEFVSAEPREANTAGGVFPALFGTVVLTLLMTAAVLPFGVLAAVFMREIATQGKLVSLVRIAVGNLAGVPSIVFGVFGLGFFCYIVGSSIDELFFAERLPTPTFGTGGILWASLTLALLTVPVVIVSTEEALAAVPRTLREASYGCGATRLQTLIHIVLPKAVPGIMTGMILAMARGMGEVAPLIMTGVVKLAPSLPVDGTFPYVHLERSFMHLGFHIYDLGFQSRSAEATRPMVFAATMLLIGLVFVLNLAAIRIRSSLRRRFEGRGAF